MLQRVRSEYADRPIRECTESENRFGTLWPIIATKHEVRSQRTRQRETEIQQKKGTRTAKAIKREGMETN